MTHARLIAIGIVIVIVSAVIGAAAGITALVYINKVETITERTDDLVTDNLEERDRSRIASCVESNVRTKAERDALKNSLLTFVPDGTILTPEQQAVFDRYSDEVDNTLSYRDCSPPGIEAYLSDPPNDPAKP